MTRTAQAKHSRVKSRVIDLNNLNLEQGQRLVPLDVELSLYGEATDDRVKVLIQDEGEHRRGELLIVIAGDSVNLAASGACDFDVMTEIAESLRDLADKVIQARDQECAVQGSPS